MEDASKFVSGLGVAKCGLHPVHVSGGGVICSYSGGSLSVKIRISKYVFFIVLEKMFFTRDHTILACGFDKSASLISII